MRINGAGVFVFVDSIAQSGALMIIDMKSDCSYDDLVKNLPLGIHNKDQQTSTWLLRYHGSWWTVGEPSNSADLKAGCPFLNRACPSYPSFSWCM